MGPGQNMSASDFLNSILFVQQQDKQQSRQGQQNYSGKSAHSNEDNNVDTSPPKAAMDRANDANNYIPNKDPFFNTTNCHRLLESYRMGEIPQMMQGTAEYPIDKSYVRRTITSKPFYVSVHDDTIDQVRTDLFLNGRYYESKLSRIIQNAFDRKQWSSPSKRKGKNSIMIDVGGNIGWFSLLAAAHGAEVFTFEPNIINMVRFCESQILNGWVSPTNERSNRIHSYLKGVSNTHGTMQPMFQVSSSNPGSFTFSNHSTKLHNITPKTIDDGRLLPLITLDALALDQGWLSSSEESKTKEEGNQNKTTSTSRRTTSPHPPPSIGFLKIDVEGLELSVLQGATRLLNAKIVENIAMEFKVAMGRRTLIEIVKILFDSGYEAYETGGWQGPSDTILSSKVVSQYKSPSSFITDLLAVFGDKDANVWFRLATESNYTDSVHHDTIP